MRIWKESYIFPIIKTLSYLLPSSAPLICEAKGDIERRLGMGQRKKKKKTQYVKGTWIIKLLGGN